MAVPKRRTTSAKRNQRRANHDRVSAPNMAACSNCGEMKLRHRACMACGFYKGKEVVAVASAVEVPTEETSSNEETSE